MFYILYNGISFETEVHGKRREWVIKLVAPRAFLKLHGRLFRRALKHVGFQKPVTVFH
ncbi:hypothetical protein NP493_1737g00000 [Ridgeia piscesae]|uniref:Uncharacterized protein n=1 Tax=Ridgeia piscesae TaxID=27915 RepID=A0AAD9JU39_RIDPI|nr:hypothetical protein NP493_1737g00000 [Ridgeia piscesae]